MVTDSSPAAVLDELERERQALSEARLALENSRTEFDRQQQEQRKILDAERARLNLDQSQLAEIKRDLENKRSQHEQLEREFKLRAQIEFQRFQEDKRNRRAEWERERNEIEGRLREREEAFRLQEEQSFRSLRDEKARLDQQAANLEKAAAAKDSEIRAQEVPLRKLQGDLATLQEEIALRERQAAAAKLATERARLEEDRALLARDAESVRKQVQEHEEAVRTKIIRKDEIAAQAKASLEARRAEVERCLTALKQRTDAEREKLQTQVAAERDHLAVEFEQKLDIQKRHSEDMEARHAAEMEALRRDIADQEAKLIEKQEALEQEQERLAEIERVSRIDPREFAANIATEEARIAARHREIEAELEKLRRARLRRTLSIAAGVLFAAVAASAAGYYVKVRLIPVVNVPGKQRWEALAKERADARSRKDWPALLRWCATTDQLFEKDEAMKPFYQAHRGEVRDSVMESVGKMFSSPSMDQDQVLADLAYFAKATPSAELVLMDAKMRINGLLRKKAASEALGVYGQAIGQFPDIAGRLSPELQRVLNMIEAHLTARDSIPNSVETLEWLDRIRNAAGSDPARGEQTRVRITAIATRLHSLSLMREGRALQALKALADLAPDDPEFRETVAGDVAQLMVAIEKLPGSELLGASAVLAKTGVLWKLPTPFVLLARSSPEEQIRFDFYRQADDLGDVEARAHVGGYYLQWGMANHSDEKIRLGLDKLQNSAAAGSSEAMLLLGDAALAGALGKNRAADALNWASKAGEKGRPEALFLKGRALLMLAEEKAGAAAGEAKGGFEEAGDLLRKAGESNPRAWFFAAQAAYHAGNLPQMVEALRKGCEAKDPGATYMLALCYVNGQAPLEQNLSLGRELMIEAAKGGNTDAIGWCTKNGISF